MGVILKNNATSTITTAISASDVGLAVAAGTGSLFPALGAGDYFYATLVSAGGTYEVVKVTARVGDTMTIARAQEGTTAQSFASGSHLEVRVTAASITDMVDEHDQASEISFTPTGTISATNVQTAVAEVSGDVTAAAAALAASSGSSLVGHIATGTGAVARTVQAKLRDMVSVKDFGSVGATALQAALNASDYVFVNAGTYNGPIDITQSNKTLVMDEGVVFFLPNGTVAGGATSGPAVLQISGDNVTIQGDFTVNGNKANNDSSSFASTVLTGSLNILGDNCRIYGTADVLNAYYRGFTVGNSLVAGGEVQGFYADKINVANANFYSVMMWSVVDWSVNEIRATTDAPGPTRDQRIRLGSQSTATSVCARGYIGLAYTDTNCGFIGEANTVDVSIDTVMAGDGGKLEDCTNVRVGHWNAYDCSRAVNRTAFFLNNATNCHVDSVIVNNYNNDGTATPGIAFSGVTSCSIGSIMSVGNQTNTPNRELRIRQADGLYIGSVVLRDPVGTCDGFFYDNGYPVQQDIVVDDLVSRGHTTWDVVVESKTAITIRRINSDAVLQFPANTYYPNITDNLFYEEGVWTPTYSTNGVDFTSVTYDGITNGRFIRVGKLVHVSCLIRTDAVTVGGATGAVVIGGLPFTSVATGNAYTAFSVAYATGFGADTPSSARVVVNSKTVELAYRTTANGNDLFLAPSDLGTGANANTLTLGGTYEIA